MDHVDEEQLPAMFVSIDYEKAFDSLEWDFINKTLNAFNFGETFKGWIHTIIQRHN